MVGVGNIVSVGGSGGGGGGGGPSGIQEINGQIGPVITLIGTSGIVISPVAPNQLNIGFSGDVSQSGVLGVNGIDVQQVNGFFVVDGAALSGLIPTGSGCYAETFIAITSGNFQHNLGTRDLIVQIADNSIPPRQIWPDSISYDTPNALSVLFNRPQSGRVTIIACGALVAGGTSTSERVELGLEFKEAFNGDTYAVITRVSGQITEINYWQTMAQVNKLFTKTITRVSGEIIQVSLVCDQTGASLVTDITRVSGQIDAITKTFTPS